MLSSTSCNVTAASRAWLEGSEQRTVMGRVGLAKRWMAELTGTAWASRVRQTPITCCPPAWLPPLPVGWPAWLQLPASWRAWPLLPASWQAWPLLRVGCPAWPLLRVGWSAWLPPQAGWLAWRPPLLLHLLPAASPASPPARACAPATRESRPWRRPASAPRPRCRPAATAAGTPRPPQSRSACTRRVTQAGERFEEGGHPTTDPTLSSLKANPCVGALLNGNGTQRRVDGVWDSGAGVVARRQPAPHKGLPMQPSPAHLVPVGVCQDHHLHRGLAGGVQADEGCQHLVPPRLHLLL